ncbi:putative DNA-binding protein [Burkholderia pseudomallei]|nr:putative DNA-binding protein [Burkholderia pseudomallei]
MTDDQSPQERVAAARQLYAILKEYLERPNWAPMEGALIVSGIHPPPDCAAIPNGGVGLDGRVFASGGNERFSDARGIWRKWTWRCEDDQENDEVTPTELPPHEFLIWCDDMDIETDWLRLCRAFYGDRTDADQVDFIPPAIVEYATQSARVIDALTARLVAQDAGATSQAASGKPLARSPMPLPENREHLSTEEFAAVLAVEPQSVRKRYSETGTYHGVRPTKLPNRRVIWPVEAVRRLLNGDKIED